MREMNEEEFQEFSKHFHETWPGVCKSLAKFFGPIDDGLYKFSVEFLLKDEEFIFTNPVLTQE